jgi:hypothetical protein
MRWTGHVAGIVEKRKACRLLAGKSGGRRLFGRTRCRWVDNIEMDLGETGLSGMDWTDLAQDSGKWRSLVKAVMNIWIL